MMLLGAVYVLNPTQTREFSGARDSDDLSTGDQCPDGSQVYTYDILLLNIGDSLKCVGKLHQIHDTLFVC